MASEARRWWRRWPVVIGAVVVAAGAGIGIWLGTSSSGPDYTFATAGTGTVEQTVSASGTIEAVNQADVNFEVSGDVTSVLATVGQAVTAGQTLAGLGTASLQASVDEASATLASDQARLDEDEDPTSTGSSGSGGSASGGASAAPSASTIDSDEAQIAAAQSQLTSAQQDLADATLVAPISGTVVAVNLTVGQSVSAGGSGAAASSSSSSSSSPDVEIQNMSSYEVQASISASDVSLVKAGDQVDITPSSSTSTVFGTVSSIALVPTVTSGVATFPIVIAVTGDPPDLYSGVSANVSIVVLDEANVLTVPTSAVHSLGGTSFVYELSKGKEVEHTVKVGATGSTETQIVSGLTSGTRVVLANRSATIPSSGTSGSPFGGLRGLGGGGLGGGGGGGFTRFGGGGNATFAPAGAPGAG